MGLIHKRTSLNKVKTFRKWNFNIKLRYNWFIDIKGLWKLISYRANEKFLVTKTPQYRFRQDFVFWNLGKKQNKVRNLTILWSIQFD